MRNTGPDIKVSINVSPQHLQSQDFINYISDPETLGQVNPANIMFEITEEMLIDNIEYALMVVKDIKKLGFQISLDDFGSGYSSLSYFSRLIFDEVRIDRSFIDQITTDSKAFTGHPNHRFPQGCVRLQRGCRRRGNAGAV